MGGCCARIGSVKRSLIFDKSFLSSIGASGKGENWGCSKIFNNYKQYNNWLKLGWWLRSSRQRLLKLC
jgi:hypothetical protein